MEAVILAGGIGSRLQPYTDNLPKALVPIGDTPIIELLLRQLRKGGVAKVHLAVNHLADQISDLLGDGSRLGLEVVYSSEPSPLSTVGPLTLIPDLPETFIVANADILTDMDVGALYQSHVQSSCELTVAAYRRSEKIDYGVLEISDSRHITGFREKPHYDFTVSMGIYVFARSVLEHVPKGQRFGFDDLMLTLLKKSMPINSYLYDGYWLDIGRPEDYLQAQHDIERIRGLLD